MSSFPRNHATHTHEPGPSERGPIPIDNHRRGRASGPRHGFVAPLSRDYAAKMRYLQSTELFAPLPADERQWLATIITTVPYAKGRVFYTPQQSGELIYILKQGRVHLSRIDNDGRKLIVDTIEPFALFGAVSLVGAQLYGCYAEAAEDSLICSLGVESFREVVRRNPEVGLLLMAELGERLHEREAELEALAFQDLPTRLATLLLREADQDGIVARYTHQDLAEQLGTYRETISQVLGRFRTERIVTVSPRRIAIIDVAGLDAYAAGVATRRGA